MAFYINNKEVQENGFNAEDFLNVLNATGNTGNEVVVYDPSDIQDWPAFASTVSKHTIRVIVQSDLIIAEKDSITGRELSSKKLATFLSQETAKWKLTPRGRALKEHVELTRTVLTPWGTPVDPFKSQGGGFKAFIRNIRSAWRHRPRFSTSLHGMKLAWRDWWKDTAPAPVPLIDLSKTPAVVLWSKENEDRLFKQWVESDFLAVWLCPQGIDEGIRVHNEFMKLTQALGPDPRLVINAIRDIFSGMKWVGTEQVRKLAQLKKMDDEKNYTTKMITKSYSKLYNEGGNRTFGGHKPNSSFEERRNKEIERNKALDELLKELESPCDDFKELSTPSEPTREWKFEPTRIVSDYKDRSDLTPSQRVELNRANKVIAEEKAKIKEQKLAVKRKRARDKRNAKRDAERVAVDVIRMAPRGAYSTERLYFANKAAAEAYMKNRSIYNPDVIEAVVVDKKPI